MALGDKLVSQLTAQVTPASTDLYPVFDAVAGLLKKQTMAQAQAAMAGGDVGWFRNLKLLTATQSTTTCAVTADAILTIGTTFGGFLISALNVTLDVSSAGAVNRLDTGAVGASTWYFLHAVSNGVTSGVLASLSAAAPTMPAGYIYRTRIGAFRTDAASKIMCFVQYGRRARWILNGTSLSDKVIASGAVGAGALTSTAIGNFAPSTAASIIVVAYEAASGNLALAPNGSYTINAASTAAPYQVTTPAATIVATLVEIPLESTNIFYGSTAAGSALNAWGWEDNL